MPKLVEVWMDLNPQLTGSLPDWLATDIPALQSVSFTSCGLSGSLPTNIGLLTNMKQLWLYNNTFGGPVPSDWSRMVNLERLELQANSLTGVIPTEICYNRLAKLTTLEADCNICEAAADPNCCTCCGAECITADN